MLKNLIIENIVLVRHANLELDSGLCVLTGETGAGKSIILNSILRLLGKETKVKSMLRQGCKYGSIEGIFENIPEDAESFLLENAITPTAELKIKCIMQTNGSTKFFINGEPVSQSLISQIGETLVEVNRQNEQTFLMQEKNHINILDDYSQSQNILDNVYEKYREIQACDNEISETIARNKQISFEVDYLQNARAELRELCIGENEYEELQERRIQNKKKHGVFETLTSASSKLEGVAIGQVLMNIHRMLSPIVTHEIESLSQTIDRVCADIQEVEGVINYLIEKNYIKTAEIDKDEERFFLLQDVARKYKIQPFEIFQFQKEIEHKIESFNKGEESIAQLQQKKQKLEDEYSQIALTLREKRKTSARALEIKINDSLKSLQMEGATFRVDFKDSSPKKNGMDIVSFMIETNKNMGFGKLSMIASGGEVSRIVLAIKAAIAHLKQIPCVIFDEIDTGISGKTSASVGDVMLKLSQNTQIIIITHQPQVAAKAHNHFRIVKKEIEGETETNVEKLEGESRTKEIARLLSGADISKEAFLNAKILLKLT